MSWAIKRKRCRDYWEVTVGDYRFTYPSANDIFRLSDATLNYVKRERVASLFYSFARNVRVVNRKATYLSGAQVWFRNSIVLLLTLTSVLALYVVFNPPTGITPPVQVPSSVTQPVLQPTSTPQLLTPTVVVSTTPSPTMTIAFSRTAVYTSTPGIITRPTP